MLYIDNKTHELVVVETKERYKGELTGHTSQYVGAVWRDEEENLYYTDGNGDTRVVPKQAMYIEQYHNQYVTPWMPPKELT